MFIATATIDYSVFRWSVTLVRPAEAVKTGRNKMLYFSTN